jgi:hypothetical protein
MDREHVKGAADEAKGAIKDAAGKVTGDKELQGAWRRGPLELSVGGDLFLRDGNLRWRRRAVSDVNPRSPARSPNCRDCAFLPVRYRSLCRDRNIAANNPGNNTEETPSVTPSRLRQCAQPRQAPLHQPPRLIRYCHCQVRAARTL